jgi:hypothetical protein
MTTTVTTVTTTVTTTTVISIGTALGLLLTLALIALLVTKELVAAGADGRALRLGRILNIGIVPLLVGFLCLAAVKVASI